MAIITEGELTYFITAPVAIIPDDMDIASDWTSEFRTTNPAYKNLIGKYAEADSPNRNNQMWELASLQESVSSLVFSPMNINHQPGNTVGVFIGSEMIYPTKVDEASLWNKVVKEEYLDMAALIEKPYIESLAVFWKSRVPEAYKKVEMAYEAGLLSYSMECTAESVTCVGEHSCGLTFAYDGPTSPTYCNEMNTRKSTKQMNNPWFMGGALVLPPHRPGWAAAQVKDIATEELIEDIMTERPGVEEKDAEDLANQLLENASRTSKAYTARALGSAIAKKKMRR